MSVPWSVGLSRPNGGRGWDKSEHWDPRYTIGNSLGPLGEAAIIADAELWTLAPEMAKAILDFAKAVDSDSGEDADRVHRQIYAMADRLRQIRSNISSSGGDGQPPR